MKKRFIVAGSMVLAAFLGMQLYRPAILPVKATGTLQAPEEVTAILKKACYDCHSSQVNLRWYDQLAPAYWQVAADVNEGRAVLNFDQWDQLAPADRKAKLWEAVNMAMLGAMPLKAYTRVHPSLKITEGDMAVLKRYLLGMTNNAIADTAITQAADRQYAEWAAGRGFEGAAPVALNGVAFDPDYKNWLPVTASERYDNGTMRLVLGNAIAIKAVQEGHTNPWPEGTRLAKVAWAQVRTAEGLISAGDFKQVEFMIRDSRKYVATKGWGFARFKTTQLKPYGKTALFATECVNCHQPMKDQDYVYTIPVAEASGAQLSGRKVVSSVIDTREGTVAIGYSDTTMPGGQLWLRWQQREDPHWFGARIPGKAMGAMDSSRRKLLNERALRPSVMP